MEFPNNEESIAATFAKAFDFPLCAPLAFVVPRYECLVLLNWKWMHYFSMQIIRDRSLKAVCSRMQ